MAETSQDAEVLEVRLTDDGIRETVSRLRSSARSTVVKGALGALLFGAAAAIFSLPDMGGPQTTVGGVAAWTGVIASIGLVALRLPGVLRAPALRSHIMTVTPTTVVFHEQGRLDGWGRRDAVYGQKTFPLSDVTTDINSRTGHIVLACRGERLKRRLDAGLTDQPAWTIYAALTRPQAVDAAQGA